MALIPGGAIKTSLGFRLASGAAGAAATAGVAGVPCSAAWSLTAGLLASREALVIDVRSGLFPCAVISRGATGQALNYCLCPNSNCFRHDGSSHKSLNQPIEVLSYSGMVFFAVWSARQGSKLVASIPANPQLRLFLGTAARVFLLGWWLWQ